MIGKALKQLVMSNGEFEFEGRPAAGLIHVTILAPDSIFIPLLPIIDNSKLKFGLCAACISSKSYKLCRHKDSERALTSVWTMAEIEFAVSKGYRIINVHEIFLYPETRDIFSNFYLRLANVKISNEGFKPHMTEAEKDEYVANINAKMPGICLKKEEIRKNSGRREFAKFLSNAGLGKFSQQSQKTSISLIYSHADFLKLRHGSPHLKIKSVCPINEDMAEVTSIVDDAVAGSQKRTNCVVYAHVTAFSRIKLMTDMLKLQSYGCRIFYTDTGERKALFLIFKRKNGFLADSIIFDAPDDDELFAQLEKEFDMGSVVYGSKQQI